MTWKVYFFTFIIIIGQCQFKVQGDNSNRRHSFKDLPLEDGQAGLDRQLSDALDMAQIETEAWNEEGSRLIRDASEEDSEAEMSIFSATSGVVINQPDSDFAPSKTLIRTRRGITGEDGNSAYMNDFQDRVPGVGFIPSSNIWDVGMRHLAKLYKSIKDSL